MNGQALDALRDPRYTGENRCPPCTVVNLGIALVASAVVGWLSLLAGVVSFVAFALVIYFRGYLVPGTPALTKRYLPPAVLALFGKEPQPVGATARAVAEAESAAGADSAGGAPAGPGSTGGGGSPAEAGDATGPESGDAGDPRDAYDVDPETVFLDLGVVEPCEEELCLTEEFEAGWYDRMDAVAGDDHLARLADLLDRDPADLSMDEEDEAVVVIDRGTPVVAWASETALRAVLAAVPELRERHPDWESVPLEVQDRLLNGLLVFVERCPDCDGTVSLSGAEANTCCTTAQLATVACEDCGTTLLEMGV